MKYFAAALGTAIGLLVTGFLTITLMDLGFAQFNHPQYQYADLVGLTGVVGGLAVAAAGLWLSARLWLRITAKSREAAAKTLKDMLGMVAVGVGLVVLGPAGCLSHKNIPPGYVGIQINLTGQDRGVQGLTLVTGRVGYNSWSQNIIEYPTFVQTVKWTASANEGKPIDESITFTSSDSMIINADISLSYELDAAKVPDFYVKFRADDIAVFTDGYLRNVVRDTFNDVAGKYTVEQLMSDNGPILKRVQAEVQQQTMTFGVKIDQLGFIGAPRPPEIVMNAINSKVQASQIALQKQNEVMQAEADAKKRVAVAQGEADANRILTSSINDNLIRWRQLDLQQQAVSKWDGKRPQVEGGSGGGGMLLNVSPSRGN